MTERKGRKPDMVANHSETPGEPKTPVEPIEGLTVKQSAFVRAYARNGGKKTQSALEAGYGEAGARNRARELLERADIQEALHTECLTLCGELAPMAIGTLRYLATNATSENIRYQASKDLADRSGVKSRPAQAPDDDHVTEEQLDKRINELMDLIKAQSLLGANPEPDHVPDEPKQGPTQH